jgi:MFS family permease
MLAEQSRHRWFVVGVFFFFMLLHQTDKLLIGPLESQSRDSFQIAKTQMGAVLTGALIVGTIFYPLRGYLYDHYARSKLLALASFILGATTRLRSAVRTYPQFVATRASTGIDDSAYSGNFILVADYFAPDLCGKGK